MGKIVIETGYAKIRFALEGAAQVMYEGSVIRAKLDNCQDESIRLIERVQNLIAGDSDHVRTRYAAIDLDEAQAAAARNSAFDIIAEFFKLTIYWFKPRPSSVCMMMARAPR